MKNVKVCILTSSFPRDEKDPAGPFVDQIATSLAQKGLNIEVLCPHDYGYPHTEYRNNISITRFPYFYPAKYQRLCYGSGMLSNIRRSTLAKCQVPFFIMAEIMFCLKMIKKHRVDIIHAQWSLPQGLTAVICRHFVKIPCITTLHGSDVYGLKYPGLQWLNAQVIKHSDVCTANSVATARMAEIISTRRKITVVPMGVNPLFLRHDCRQDAIKTATANGQNRILYVGRLIDWKGVNYLIQALPEVLKKFPKTQLIVVGSGPMKDDLVALSNRLKLGTKVVYIDNVPQEKLLKVYSSASLFVLPSIVNEKGETEGLGVVLLEAMACGLPVVGSNVGGIPDIIKDGETGLLARPKEPNSLAEKITEVFSNAALRQKLVENGPKMVEKKFSWDTISEKFIEIYREVLNRSGRGAGVN
jgi:glycosyltransferase involved in cell wall biosynthesis